MAIQTQYGLTADDTAYPLRVFVISDFPLLLAGLAGMGLLKAVL